MYLQRVKPFFSLEQNRFEVINETGICLDVSILMLLCNSIYTSDQRDYIGWTLIGAISLVLACNAYRLMKKMLFVNAYGYYSSVRKHYRNWMYVSGKQEWLNRKVYRFKLFPQDWERKRDMYNAQETIDLEKAKEDLQIRYDELKEEIDWHNYYKLSQINIFDTIKQYNKDLQKYLKRRKRFAHITKADLD